MLDRLQATGLVDKGSCESDARVTYAVITDRGFEKLKEASQTHLAGIHELFESRYSEEELATLAELLGRLPAAGEEAGDCSP